MASGGMLVGDIGGTNARFALAGGHGVDFDHLLELECADFESSTDAVRHYLDAVGAGRVEAVCLAVAGPVVAGEVRMTNSPWIVSTAEIRKGLRVDSVRLINDFEAIALSIPLLDRRDFLTIGSCRYEGLPEGDFGIAVVGPGTGLGVAGLLRRQGLLVPVTGEGGHVGCAPESSPQAEIVEVLRKKFDRVSAERLVAGTGVENIHAALVTINGMSAEPLSASQVFAKARSGDSLAEQAVNVFFEMLGQIAGDLALTIGAWDGVFIAGGIAKRYPSMLEDSSFRQAFEAKGRYRSLMAGIPTLLITHDQPGLVGAAAALRR